jgi:hypothetical protein
MAFCNLQRISVCGVRHPDATTNIQKYKLENEIKFKKIK